jgi:putative transposase
MPWKEVKPMDEKVLFIADCLRGYETITALCQRYGISRKTGYKWLERYRHDGMSGLSEQSRTPKHSPQLTPYPIQQVIIELRTGRRITPGPKKLRHLLAQRFPNEPIPSKTTIYNILHRAGLISPQSRRRRVPPSPRPFDPVRDPNAVWTTDFKGQFKLLGGGWCYPLTVMDHHSRYLLACQGLTGTGTRDARRVFIRLFKEYGLPQRIRSDNGVPFATTATAGLSRLAIWWIRLGILPERITPGRPQENGRHERMHRTLKAAATRPPATTFSAQQRRFDLFREEYNQQRPHEALQQQTPAAWYTPSSRCYPDKLPPLVYPDYYAVRRVQPTGVVYWRGGQLYVSHLLHNEQIGLVEIADGVFDIFFGLFRLGQFDMRHFHQGSVRYWSLHV